MATPKTIKRIREGFPGQRLVVVPKTVLRRAGGLPFVRSLFPTHIGRFDRAAGHFVERAGGCAEAVLLVCLQGEGFVRTPRRRFVLREGMAILLPPRESHTYGAHPERPWSLVWLHLTGSSVSGLTAVLNPSPAASGDPFYIESIDVVVEAFEETFRHVLGAYSDRDLIGLSTGAIRFVGLLRTLQRARPGVSRDSEDRVLKTIRFMREHLAAPLTLQDLARVGGWAPTHYAAVFRRQTQMPPLTFLTRLRLQRACELLKTTEATLADIGSRVGYPDPFYFSRVFARHQGLAPSAYRRLYTARPLAGPAGRL